MNKLFALVLFAVIMTASAFVAKSAGAQFGVARGGSQLSMIAEGDKLPMDSSFMVIGEDGPKEVSVLEAFGGKKVAVCGLPGAFTPTCSETHLPGAGRGRRAFGSLLTMLFLLFVVFIYNRYTAPLSCNVANTFFSQILATSSEHFLLSRSDLGYCLRDCLTLFQ
mmetsp:Transcript_23082/g.36365  ORF Transcript_23082/g.36365 Transcript_23082/m.36365 type:complete len:165 (-) Transcript_23082:613-1107(-)